MISSQKTGPTNIAIHLVRWKAAVSNRKGTRDVGRHASIYDQQFL